MGRGAAARAPPDACRRHHGLPRLDPLRPPAAAGRDERAAARNGRHAEFRPVQSRPPDLCRTQARRYREAVRTAIGPNLSDVIARSEATKQSREPRAHLELDCFAALAMTA